MSRSFAPSPTATTPTASTRFWNVASQRALAARSTRSPVVRPVSRPSRTSRRFAANMSMPNRAAMGSTTSSNPPDTRATCPPPRFTDAISSSAPGLIVTDAATSANTPVGTPASVATRSVRLSPKSSSPRMARSVISATWARVPACSANRSMTSSVRIVESTSLTSSPGPPTAKGPVVTAAATLSASAHARIRVVKSVTSPDTVTPPNDAANRPERSRNTGETPVISATWPTSASSNGSWDTNPTCTSLMTANLAG